MEGVASRRAKEKPTAGEDDPGRPSVLLKGQNIKELTNAIHTMASNQHAMALRQQQLLFYLCQKSGVPLPKELRDQGEYEVTVNHLELFAMKEVKVEKLPNPLDLENVQVVLEPCFLVLLWECKGNEFTSLSLTDSFGVEGPFIASYRNRIAELWPTLEPSSVKDILNDTKILAHGYLALRHQLAADVESSERLAKEFFVNHRDLTKRLRHVLLSHHIGAIRSACGPASAAKFEASMGVLAADNNPVNSSGAIKSALINFAVERRGGPVRQDDGGGRGERKGNRKKRIRDSSGNQACDHCGEMIPFKGFKEHNKVCKGKKK